MSYTPLSSDFLASTLLANGPDVVACWALLMASADKLGETTLTPSACASLLRISDERAEAAFEILAGPDRRSRNRDHEGRRIIDLGDGRWLLVSHLKYQQRASKANAAERQARYKARHAPTAAFETGTPEDERGVDLAAVAREPGEEG